MGAIILSATSTGEICGPKILISDLCTGSRYRPHKKDKNSL